MITKNAGKTLKSSLDSVKNIASEIIVIDDNSEDKTRNIARANGARIIIRTEYDLGKQKQFGLERAKYEWVLLLDSDEIVSRELSQEIKDILHIKKSDTVAYWVPFKNKLLTYVLRYGGEAYSKLIFFNKKFAIVHAALIHENVFVKSSKIGSLTNSVIHQSYRSIPQMFSKFTDYGLRSAKQKSFDGERTSLKKILMYPPHLFWARFVKDKGYKDGPLRIILDLGFAWMEFLTYFLLLFLQKKENKKE